MIEKTVRRIVGQNDRDFVIRDPFLRLIAVVCGLVLAYISLTFSKQFGDSISPEMGYACAAISLLSSFMVAIWFAARETFAELNAMQWLRGFTAVAIALVGWDAFTNSMTASFQRHGDIVQAKTEAQAKDSKGKTAADLEAQKARLEARKDKLQADFDAMTVKKVGTWTVAVAPLASAAYDEMITAKKVEQEREERTGRGPKYQDRTNELAHLTGLQSLAKAMEDNQADHARVLTALANTRNEQSEIVVTQSGASFQSAKLASWVGLAQGDVARNPSDLLVAWTEDGMGSLAGIMIMLGGQAFLGIGFARINQIRMTARRREDEVAPDRMADYAPRRTEDDKPASALVPQMGFVPQPTAATVHKAGDTYVKITDDTAFARAFLAKLNATS